MNRFQLRKCCCCLSLRTGAQIIGVLSMLGGLVGLVCGLILIVSVRNADAVHGSEMIWSSAVNQIIGSIVLIAVTVSLLVSAIKNRKPMLLVPWLVLKSITVLYVICYSFYLAITSLVAGNAVMLFLVAGLIVVTVVYSYFCLVIYSYYNELATGLKKEAQQYSNENVDFKL